ncbi:alpha/beta hydrolase family protein [Ramlibacter humi]|uniref:Dienelactone hydrolase n=1 Tax=Ramlibacter humi TaxID=2530451 RepID=A0A4Z0CBA6_9BURK|nr:alpha/beta hydrolase [Ramlibacter humi]TFZ08883.1 dienelactone hydrolase [Ramlibacter humi]
MKRYFIATILAAAAAFAQAGMGVMQLPGQAGDGPVTVFYPTAAPDEETQRGPFTLKLAPPQSPLQKGNGRLVVISHGSGGNAWVHSDLAHALVDAGYVVAMPQHRGDNASDPSHPGPQSWKIRPLEVSRAIDAVAADARLAPLLSLDKVGMYGMSAGGHTALSLAGGRSSPAAFAAHCEQDIADDFPACVGLLTRRTGSWFDNVKIFFAKAVIHSRFAGDTEGATHTDPRIAAIVAGVPFAADFDPPSLANPPVPLGLVTAAKDAWLPPRFHSDRILAACQPRCELVAALPDGGHGALLSPPPPARVLSEKELALLGDPPGFDRGATVPAVDRAIVSFFQRRLAP